MKKLIPADTVDADGTVWETTGENIRNGAKTFSETAVKAIVDILFPIGSVYCGENSLVLSVGTWNIISFSSRAIVNSVNAISGTVLNSKYVVDSQEVAVGAVALRMWKRVS